MNSHHKGVMMERAKSDLIATCERRSSNIGAFVRSFIIAPWRCCLRTLGQICEYTTQGPAPQSLRHNVCFQKVYFPKYLFSKCPTHKRYSGQNG